MDGIDDTGAPPQPIHLGLRSGINPLRAHLRSLKAIGVNHVAGNLRLNRADTEKAMKCRGLSHYRSQHSGRTGCTVRGQYDRTLLLTQRLQPLFGSSERVINVSSAAQAPVNLEALAGRIRLSDMVAYSQSKLALTMWSHTLAHSLEDDGPAVIAVNAGSLLATKRVKEDFGVAGKDIRIGADILLRAALSDEFAAASGQYFDNDADRFASPHPDALDPHKCREVVRVIGAVLVETAQPAQSRLWFRTQAPPPPQIRVI